MPTAMETTAYKKLAALAKRLGGQIIPTDGPWEGEKWETFPKNMGRRGWSTAPFCANIGVYWAKKVIAHKKVGFSTAGLVHEMGHVFASKTPPNAKDTDEVDFLGWEVTLAASLGIRAAWVRARCNAYQPSATYGTSNSTFMVSQSFTNGYCCTMVASIRAAISRQVSTVYDSQRSAG